MQVWYEIPVDLTSNFDQTPFPYICTGNCRYAKKQSSNVPLVKNGKKKFHNYQVWTISSHAAYLKRNDQSMPFKKVSIFLLILMRHAKPIDQAMSRKQINIQRKQCFRFSKKKKERNSPLDQKAIFQFDVFEEHVIEKVAFIIEENNSVIIYVSNNLTHQFLPLELNVRS